MTDARRIARTPIAVLADALCRTDGPIAVTGATGWFGTVAMDMLYEALGAAAPERVVGYASRARELVVADGRIAQVRALDALAEQDPSPTTLLHLAFIPRDRIATLGVDAYVRQSIAISTRVLAAVAEHRPRHVVVTSSGAARAAAGGWQTDLAHAPYGALKRLDELAFRAAVRDVGGCCVVPRVFSVGGSRLARPDVFALASMIEMARAGGPIVVHARGPVVRTYSGVDEVIALGLWAAGSGTEIAFDTCGAPTEIGELAHVVARVHGLGPDAVQRTWEPGARADRYVGDGEVMIDLATRAGLRLRPLDELVRASSPGSPPATGS